MRIVLSDYEAKGASNIIGIGQILISDLRGTLQIQNLIVQGKVRLGKEGKIIMFHHSLMMTGRRHACYPGWGSLGIATSVELYSKFSRKENVSYNS